VSRRAALTITQADLQTAYTLRRRADWPATFDQAMADPLLCRLVRAEALRRAQALQDRAQQAANKPAQQVRLPAPPVTPRPSFDCKRAAAGDRDDD